MLLGVYEMLLQLKGNSADASAPMLAGAWEVNPDRSKHTFHRYTERWLALEALEVQVRVYSNRIPDENEEPYPRWTVTLGSVR